MGRAPRAGALTPPRQGLWDTAQRARADPLGRIVVTPLVHEARGLDAGPRLVQKLYSMADHVRLGGGGWHRVAMRPAPVRGPGGVAAGI